VSPFRLAPLSPFDYIWDTLLLAGTVLLVARATRVTYMLEHILEPRSRVPLITHWTRRTIRAAVICAALVVTPVAARQNVTSNDVSALLQRQTQELMDAIAAGDRAPWTRYLHDSIIYAAEDGRVKSKAELLDELRPLPKEIWGRLHVTDFRAILHGSTAITNYIADEEEGYFGQVLHARYRSTDTWVQERGGWVLIASHILALRDDPPSIDLPDAKLDEYVGVYSLTPDVTYTIRRENGALVGVRTARAPETLKSELADCLFVPGQPRLRKIFQRDPTGRVAGFVERRESWDVRWQRVR
jgi:Domain of unknown function (DUF4440)